ncbi:hypothetical protein J4216_04165 [Candidatus Woesearchaeota archaeon]|nr:hypothetical protein [Candidatus Woesearchaeota archaeon]
MVKFTTKVYLFGHSEFEELDTPILRGLISGVDFVYFECGVASLDDTKLRSKREFSWNKYSKNGELDELLRTRLDKGFHADSGVNFVIDQARNNGKTPNIVFEKYDKPIQDYMLLRAKPIESYVRGFPLESVLELQQTFLEKTEYQQQEREDHEARYIESLAGSRLVLFGAAHVDLVDKIGESAEVYFPFEDYPISFETKMLQEFRRTGKVNPEFFQKSIMEAIARRSVGVILRDSDSYEKVEILSHYYANTLTTEQIEGFRTYSKLMMFLNGRITDGEIFNRYLQEELKLDSVEDTTNGIRR